MSQRAQSRARKAKPQGRLCELPVCGAEIGEGMLMCLEHWRTVPRAEQRRVSQCYRKLKSRRDQRALDAYREAVAAAVAAVEAQLP